MDATYNAPNELVDGDNGVAVGNRAVVFSATTTAAPVAVYRFEMPMPVQLDTIFLGYVNTFTHFNANTRLLLQGTNDTLNWINLNDTLTYTTTTATNGVTTVPGVSGTNNANIFLLQRMVQNINIIEFTG